MQQAANQTSSTALAAHAELAGTPPLVARRRADGLRLQVAPPFSLGSGGLGAAGVAASGVRAGSGGGREAGLLAVLLERFAVLGLQRAALTPSQHPRTRRSSAFVEQHEATQRESHGASQSCPQEPLLGWFFFRCTHLLAVAPHTLHSLGCKGQGCLGGGGGGGGGRGGDRQAVHERRGPCTGRRALHLARPLVVRPGSPRCRMPHCPIRPQHLVCLTLPLLLLLASAPEPVGTACQSHSHRSCNMSKAGRRLCLHPAEPPRRRSSEGQATPPCRAACRAAAVHAPRPAPQGLSPGLRDAHLCKPACVLGRRQQRSCAGTEAANVAAGGELW